MQRAVQAAAQMGRAHGLAGAQPYGPFDADGNDSRLMTASGRCGGRPYILVLAKTDAWLPALRLPGGRRRIPVDLPVRDPGIAAVHATSCDRLARAPSG